MDLQNLAAAFLLVHFGPIVLAKRQCPRVGHMKEYPLPGLLVSRHSG